MNDGIVPVEQLVSTLNREIEEFEALRADYFKQVQELMAQEDVKAGRVFAKEIFELKQERLRMETEVLARRNKLRRLAMGYE